MDWEVDELIRIQERNAVPNLASRLMKRKEPAVQWRFVRP